MKNDPINRIQEAVEKAASYPQYLILSRWDFMVMSRWYGYTYEEAEEAWKEKSGGKHAICVTVEEFNKIGSDKSTLYEQKHPVSDEQKAKWWKEALEALSNHEKEGDSEKDE